MTVTPLGTPRAWTTVVARDGHRCHCTGACGSKHTTDNGRCRRTSDHDRLYVAPEDLTLSDVEMAALPAEQYRAWCLGCYKAADSRQHAEKRQAAIDAHARGEQSYLF
ncbi:hypothetical protein [Streptomyces sp. NPDC001966]